MLFPDRGIVGMVTMQPVLGSFMVRVWSLSEKLQMMLSVRMLNGHPSKTLNATDPTMWTWR